MLSKDPTNFCPCGQATPPDLPWARYFLTFSFGCCKEVQGGPAQDYQDFKDTILAIMGKGGIRPEIRLHDLVCRRRYKIDYKLINGIHGFEATRLE